MSMPAACGCTTSKLRSPTYNFRAISRRCFRFMCCQLFCSYPPKYSTRHGASLTEFLVRATTPKGGPCLTKTYHGSRITGHVAHTSTGGVLRTSGRHPLGAPDFFHAVLDSLREFGFRGSFGQGHRSTATIPSPDRNRPMFESWKQMDQVGYAHSRLWRD